MAKIWLSIAALSGFLSVALGAFGAHGLKGVLDQYGKGIYETAVQYHMYHSLALLAVGALQICRPKCNLKLSGGSFIIGMVLFSGSLYLLALTGLKWLGAVTPVGGITLLLGWAGLFYAVSRQKGWSTS